SFAAFDRQHATFRLRAAMGRKAADLAAGRQHAMAWDDDRERIMAECLPYGACRAGGTELCCDLAIGERLSRRDRTCHLVNAAVERRYSLHVERDRREV